MSKAIELTYRQAEALVSAGICERKRIRHINEPWQSEALRDEKKRDDYIAKAEELGVPYAQAIRFVASARNDYENWLKENGDN